MTCQSPLILDIMREKALCSGTADELFGTEALAADAPLLLRGTVYRNL